MHGLVPRVWPSKHGLRGLTIVLTLPVLLVRFQPNSKQFGLSPPSRTRTRAADSAEAAGAYITYTVREICPHADQAFFGNGLGGSRICTRRTEPNQSFQMSVCSRGRAMLEAADLGWQLSGLRTYDFLADATPIDTAKELGATIHETRH